MKKLILSILLIVFGLISFAQPKIIRSSAANTVYDTRHGGLLNEIVPVYPDTTTANLAANIGLDSCGAIIFTYADSGKLYVRKCFPTKYWAVIGGGGSSGGGSSTGINGLTGTTSIALGSSTALSQYTTIIPGSFALTINHNGVDSTAQSDSNTIRLTNNTLATGVSSAITSPGVMFKTSGWRTAGGGSAKDHRYMIDATGLSTTAINGNSLFRLRVNPNNVGYSTIFSISSAGIIQQNLNVNGTLFGNTGVGSNNVKAGDLTMMNVTTAIANVAVGVEVLENHKTGDDNTAVGYAAMIFDTSGVENTAIGARALFTNKNGSQNTSIGRSSMFSNTTGSGNVAIGNGSLGGATPTNDVAIGNNSMAGNNSGTGFNTAIGGSSLLSNTTGNQLTAIGFNSLQANTTAIKNTFVGAGSGEFTTTGGFNSGLGEDVFLHNITGINNVAMGWLTLATMTAGNGNVAMGFNAGTTPTGGDNNIFIGYQSGSQGGQTATPTNSIAIGAESFTTASNQMVLGNSSLTQTIIFGTTHNNTAALTVAMIDTTTNMVYHIPANQLTAGSVVFNGLLGATGTSSIDNGNFPQTWNWNSLTNNTAITMNSSSTTATSGQVLVGLILQGANAASTVTSAALYVQNVHTGTSSTNVAAQFSATSATNNYAIIVPASQGRIGFGTSTPAVQFHNVGTVRFASLGSASTDTTTYKPMAIDATGNLIPMNSWAQVSGSSGTVTSVGFTGGLISVANPTTTPAFTVAGTSGGVPYFSSTSTWASSALLVANAIMIGGGSATAPSTTTTGTGVLTALGINVGSAGAFVTFNGALGTPSSGTLTNATGYLWNNLANPTADQSLTFAAGFSSTWTNSNTTEDLLTINTSTLTTASLFSLNSTSTALAAGNNLAEFIMSGANGSSTITATALRASVTNTGTGSINIGLDITASGGSINRAIVATGDMRLTTFATTGTGTSSGLSIDGSSVTSGTAFNIFSNAAGFTTGTLLNLSSTTTGRTGTTSTVANIVSSGANGTNAVTVIGETISVTNTNATSGTNVGLSITASGATTDNIAISVTGATRLTYSGTTQTTTTSGLVLLANSLTTGTAAYIPSSSVTSGNLLQLVSSSTTLAANNEMLDIAVSGANGTNAITATGARISVTNTNATSGTNIGLDLTASGATTDNIALQASAGSVNIGTTATAIAAQTMLLKIYNTSSNASAITEQRFFNDQGTTTSDGFRIFYASSNFASPYASSVGFWNYENGPMVFATNNGERMRISSGGGVLLSGLTTAQTAWLGIGAGTTAVTPIHFASGALNTGGAIIAGNFEFLTDKWYGTITTGTAQKEFTMNDAALTSGTFPVATTNGRLTNSTLTTADLKAIYSGGFSGVGTATTVFTVTIGVTMANANYECAVAPTAALSAALFYVTNKTTTTFDVTYLAGLTGTVTFDWIVTP